MRSYALVTTVLILIIATQHGFVKCGQKLDIDGLKNMLKPMSKSCKGKTGVTDELIELTHKGEFRREKPLMCYFKCLSVMLKIMNKQGQVTPEAVQKQIDILVIDTLAPTLIDVGTRCFEKVVPPPADACEYAFELVVCAYNEDKTIYFLP